MNMYELKQYLELNAKHTLTLYFTSTETVKVNQRMYEKTDYLSYSIKNITWEENQLVVDLHGEPEKYFIVIFDPNDWREVMQRFDCEMKDIGHPTKKGDPSILLKNMKPEESDHLAQCALGNLDDFIEIIDDSILKGDGWEIVSTIQTVV